MRTRAPFAGLTIAVAVAVSAALAQTPGPSSPATGDVARGKTLFDQTLRCYACHGFDGQTGSPRLVPMSRAEQEFIEYLRKPATPGMPAFADVPERDLADVYAYIRSLKPAAPPIDSIPLLKGILDRRQKSN